MIELYTILLILWAHWIGDFIMQSDWHATNKSSNNWILLHHVGCYSIPLLMIGFLVPISMAWVLINAILHAVTDWCTSRMTSKLWVAGERHWFFVVIGLDQSIHFTTLFATYYWLCSTL